MALALFLGGFLLLSLGGNLLGFRYWLNLWYGLDCTVNAVFGGDPRETISSRWGKAINRGSRPATVVARVTRLEAHFVESVNEDVGRHSVPVAMVVVGLIWILVLVRVWFGR